MTHDLIAAALRFTRLACLALILMPSLVWATPVRWILSNAKFADGGTITGNFVYDVDTNTLSSFSVTTAGGNTTSFPVFTYSAGSATGNVQTGFGNPQPAVLLFANNSQRGLRMTPSIAFTNAGGTVPIDLNTANDHSAGLECFNCGPARVIVAGSFVGQPITPNFVINSSISGNWYDPAQNGHGFQIEVLPGGVATAFWFTFDNAGNQVWINAVGSLGNDSVAMTAGRVLNGRFPPNFNPNTVTKPSWGALNFSFVGCNDATVTWTSTDPAFTPNGTMILKRLTSIDGLPCN